MYCSLEYAGKSINQYVWYDTLHTYIEQIIYHKIYEHTDNISYKDMNTEIIYQKRYDHTDDILFKICKHR